jgi:hypothetical protein
MNRTSVMGIAIVFAIIGLTMVATEQDASARGRLFRKRHCTTCKPVVCKTCEPVHVHTVAQKDEVAQKDAPAQKEEVAQKEEAPAQKEAAPAQKEEAPAQKEEAPAQKEEAPAQKEEPGQKEA